MHQLHSTTAAIGKDALGFAPNETGVKSMHSSAALGWHLAGMPHPSIQLMRRWKSEAWTCCIRKQDLEFSKGMSKSLLQNEFSRALPALSEGDFSSCARPVHSCA